MENESVAEQTDTSTTNKSNKGLSIVMATVIILGLAWILIRPGVFTIQPIGALPEGITFIYHSRNPEMPFFSSPDGMCLEIQGGVSLLCRGAAISGSTELMERLIIRLSYSHWAYLRSTGGREFDR